MVVKRTGELRYMLFSRTSSVDLNKPPYLVSSFFTKIDTKNSTLKDNLDLFLLWQEYVYFSGSVFIILSEENKRNDFLFG